MKRKANLRRNILLLMAGILLAILLYTLVRFDMADNPGRYSNHGIAGIFRSTGVLLRKEQIKRDVAAKSVILTACVLLGGGAFLYLARKG